MTAERRSPWWRLSLSLAILVGLAVVIPNLLPSGGSFPWDAFIPVAGICAGWVFYLLVRSRCWMDIAVACISALMYLSFLLGTFRDYRPAKRPEVKSNLGAILATQVAYFAEWNVYVGNQPLTPIADRRRHPEMVKWDPNTRFSILGFAPEGSVYYSYALEGPVWSKEGFTARAVADLDDDGQLSVYTITNSGSEVTHSGDGL